MPLFSPWPVRRLRIATLLGVVLCALAACAGHTPTGNTALGAAMGPVVIPADLRTALPDLPSGADDQFSLRRVIATATWTLLGSQGLLYSNNTVVTGPSAHLSPAANEAAYAIYSFAAAPANVLTSIDYHVSSLSPGGSIYIAIADYTHNCWSFFPVQTALSGSLSPGSDNYVSSAGHIYLAVFAWNNQGYDLDSLGVALPSRHAILGKVVDHAGVAVTGALVGTPLAGQHTYSDSAGNYQLDGLPDGMWPVVVTKTGYTFFGQPQSVTLAGGNGSLPNFVGEQLGEHLKPGDTDEPNQSYSTAHRIPWGTDHAASMSVTDDRDDYYRIALANVGWYWFELDSTGSEILYPALELYDPSADRLLPTSSPDFTYGTTWIGLFVSSGGRDVVLHVTASGGGGAYTLKMFNSAAKGHTCGVALDNGTDQPYAVKVKLHSGARGTDSLYFADSASPHAFAGTFPPDQYTLSPQDDLYTFTPATKDIDLTTTDAPTATFSFNTPAPTDSHEPNNTPVQAFNVPSLPFTEAGANALSASDGSDYFHITPAAGKFLRIAANVATPTPPGYAHPPLKVSVFDSTLSPVNGLLAPTTSGIEFRSGATCDGNAYYVKVERDGDNRARRYDIHIEAFDGQLVDYSLQIAGGTPLSGSGMIRVHSDSFNWQADLYIDAASSTTAGIACPAGERLFAECYRFGVSCDRDTRTTTVAGAAVHEVFTATVGISGELDGQDSTEPNNTFGQAPIVTLPFAVAASISSLSDPHDYYCFQGDAAQCTRIQVTCPQPLHADETDVLLIVSDAAHNPVVQTGLSLDGVVDLITPPLGNQLCYLDVYSTYSDTAYALNIDQVTAYPITFHYFDNATLAGEEFVGITDSVSRKIVYTDAAGDASAGYYLPGNHFWQIYKTNRALLSNGGDDAVGGSISGPTQFTDGMLPDNRDTGEPNNNQASATTLTTNGVAIAATVSNWEGDVADFYKFTVTAGAKLLIDCNTQRTSGLLHTTLLDPSGTLTLTDISLTPWITDGTIDFQVPVSGTYYLRIEPATYGSDYVISATKH